MVIAEFGLDRFRSGYYSDAQFELLGNKMLEIDARAVLEDSFWRDELNIMESRRRDYRGPGIDPF